MKTLRSINYYINAPIARVWFDSNWHVVPILNMKDPQPIEDESLYIAIVGVTDKSLQKRADVYSVELNGVSLEIYKDDQPEIYKKLQWFDLTNELEVMTSMALLLRKNSQNIGQLIDIYSVDWLQLY
jgi:hypothetical protein